MDSVVKIEEVSLIISVLLAPVLTVAAVDSIGPVVLEAPVSMVAYVMTEKYQQSNMCM